MKTQGAKRKSTPAFKPTRGRPTAVQAEAISRSIIAAATERFLSVGYERTSMDAVAAAAGVPKTTLYKRYPNKLSVLRAVIAERIAAWSEISGKDDPSLPKDLEQRLRHSAEAVLVWSGSDEVLAFARLASGPGEGPAEVAQVLYEIGYLRMVAHIERDIRTFGGRSIKDPRGVANALMALLSGWLALRNVRVNVSAREAKAFAHKAVELLTHGKSAW